MSHPSSSNEPPRSPPPQQFESSTSSRRPANEGNGPARREHGGPFTASLPSVTTLTSFSGLSTSTSSAPDPGSATTGRPLGVHSILNPSGEQPPSNVQRAVHSPNRSVSIAYGAQPAPNLSPRSRKRGDRSSPGQETASFADGRPGRRILTPRSPAARVASLGAGGGSSTRYPPGPSEGRIYTAEPGQSRSGVIPPLPPLSAAPPASLRPLPPSEASASRPRLNAGTIGLPHPAMPVHRNPGSPEPSHPSYDRTAGSPFPSLPLESAASSSASPAFPPGGRFAQRTYPEEAEYLLNLEIGQVPMNIDFGQASKLADEKRKRNAGASARFRQRRKEKEQAAAHAIDELRRRLREAEEDREFYSRERNFFRDMVARNMGAAQVPPRPPSPQIRRMQAGPPPLPVEAALEMEYGQRESSEAGPSQRRRTGEYPPNFAASTMAPAPFPNFPQHPQQRHALPPPIGPATVMDARAQPPGSLPPTTKSQSQDPFRQNMLR